MDMRLSIHGCLRCYMNPRVPGLASCRECIENAFVECGEAFRVTVSQGNLQ